MMLSSDTIDWVLKNIPRGPLLEFGSGKSTLLWAQHGYDVLSIEHNPKWVTDHSVLAPIVNGWYDLTDIKLNKRWNAVILDGPSSSMCRDGFLGCYIQQGLEYVTIIVDDTNTAGRTDGFVDKRCQHVVERILATGCYESLQVGRSTVLLPIRIKTDVTHVDIFVDGGFANRMSQIINGLSAARLYKASYTCHWPLTQHMKCEASDLIDLDTITYTDLKAFAETASASRARSRVGYIENGISHFGLPNRFLTTCDPRFRHVTKQVLASVKPKVPNVLDLRGRTAYAVRTLAPGSPKTMPVIPAGSFLTTDSVSVVAANPKCINTQTIFGKHDYDIQRTSAGMREAVADWFSMLSADKIVYTNQQSSFTRAHEEVAMLPRKRYQSCRIIAILPEFVIASTMWKTLQDKIGIPITTAGISSNYAAICREAANLITWGMKLRHEQYTSFHQNILFCENGLLKQNSGLYVDHAGYFADSSLVTENLNNQQATEQEISDLRDHLEACYPNFKWQPTGYFLVSLQMNGDAPMRHYYPAAQGRTDRVAVFLDSLRASLPADQSVIIRQHPREKFDCNRWLNGSWQLDTEPNFAKSLSRAAKLITINSTTATEALALGVPVETHGLGCFTGHKNHVDYACAVLRHQIPFHATVIDNLSVDTFIKRMI